MIAPSSNILIILTMLFKNVFSLARFRPATTFKLSHNQRSLSMSTVGAFPDQKSVTAFLTTPHPNNNIPEQIIEKIGTNLHLKNDHPLGIIKTRYKVLLWLKSNYYFFVSLSFLYTYIYTYTTYPFLFTYTSIRIENYCNKYAKEKGQQQFAIHDGLVPIVDTKSCFDDLLVGPDHVSRRPSDTYYATDKIVRFLINYKYLFMIILLIFHSTSISKIIIYLF